jgi:glycosyltransferase involved in cell wall biosynthesis
MITVIIATRDRAALLNETLEAIGRQDPPGVPFEVVVVDNGSVDNTREMVANAAGRLPLAIRYVHEPRPGKSHALNTAVATAHGDILVFTDDDVLPSPGWLAAFVRALHETGADFATGRILPRWEAAPPAWMSPQLYGALSVADGGPDRVALSKGTNSHIMPMGGNLALRRHVVERIGGWNPDLGSLQGTLRTGEDHEFALKMLDAGFAGVYEPEAAVSHRVPADRLRVGYFLRWLTTNGGIHAALEAQFPSTPHYLLSVPRYRWRLFANDVLDGAAGLFSFNYRRVIAAYLRMTWFVAYVRGRWDLRGRALGDAAAQQR